MLPVQNFNGFDHPWVGGSGANQLDFDNSTKFRGTVSGTADNFTFTVTASGSTGVFFPLPDSFAGKTMYLSGNIVRTGTHANDIAVQLQRTKNGTVSYIAKDYYTNNALTLEDLPIAFGSDESNFILRFIASASADDSTGETMTVTNIRLCDETGQAWSPYANICPIYGHTSATATRCARNFLENKCETYTFVAGVTVTVGSDGTFTINGTLASAAVLYYNIQTNAKAITTQRDNVKHLPNGNYIAFVIGDAGARLQVMVYNPGETLNILAYANGGESVPFTIGNDYRYNFCRLYLAAGTYNDATAKLTIRSAIDSDSSFEPYQGDAYTVQFGRTVYGGKVDFVTGVLTSTMNLIELDGSETYTMSASYGLISVGRAAYTAAKTDGNIVSNQFVYGRGASRPFGSVFVSSAENGIIQFTNGDARFADAASFAAFVTAQYNAGTPIQLCYELKEPVTIQFTPQQIATLIGHNNIWATTTTNES